MANGLSHYLSLQIEKTTPRQAALCQKGKLGAIVSGGETSYVVAGREVWKMNKNDDLMTENPEDIGAVWPGLNKRPDAGFTWHNGFQYIFKGKHFHRKCMKT